MDPIKKGDKMGFADLDKFADKARDEGVKAKDKAKKAYEELTE
jgi:hypothetical protein